MANTVLQAVNKVLRKLRESAVTTIEGDEYAELITDFLSETKSEIEDAEDWRSLQGTVLLDTVVDTYRYKLAAVYEGSKISDIYDQANDCYLEFNPSVVKEGLKYASPETGQAKYYDFVGYNDGEMLIDIFPVPDVADVRLYVNGKYVQGDLGYTSPDTTYLAVPQMPLVLGTYAKAIDERGDDDGEAYNKADAKYKVALADAISMENAAKGEPKIWEVE